MNPELIYYSIKYFNAMVDTTSDRFFLTSIIKIRNMYQARYIKWIRNLENRIEQGNSNSELKRISINYLDDYLFNVKNDSVPGLSEKTDINFMNYLIVKYYLQDAALRYNRNEDYKSYRERLEEKKADSFPAILKKPASFDKSDLENVIAHWYIFEGSDKITNNTNPSLIITKTLDAYYRNSFIRRFNFSLGYSYLNYFMEPGKDIYGSLFVPPDLEYEFNSQSFIASMSYKIFLSHYIGMFSFIDFQLSAGYSSINKNYPSENFSHKKAKVDGVSNRYEIFEATSSMLSIKDIKFTDFSITTPIIFLWKNFSINCGLGIQTSFAHYKIKYDFSYRKFESEFLAPKILYSESGEDVEKEDSSLKSSPSPLIYCTYYFITPFILQGRISTNSFSINIGMEF